MKNSLSAQPSFVDGNDNALLVNDTITDIAYLHSVEDENVNENDSSR